MDGSVLAFEVSFFRPILNAKFDVELPIFDKVDFSSKNLCRSCKSEQASGAKSDPEMVFGSFCLWSSSVFWTQKIETNVD